MNPAASAIKNYGKIGHRETDRFDHKQGASAWLERRERELDRRGVLKREKAPDPIFATVIDRYLTMGRGSPRKRGHVVPISKKGSRRHHLSKPPYVPVQRKHRPPDAGIGQLGKVGRA